MSPKEFRTSAGGSAQGRRRLSIAEQYLALAEMLEDDPSDGAVNACIGNCVLAGIAAADAICYARLGERYSGPDHDQAADFLDRVDKELGGKLRVLGRLKTRSQYGDEWLTDSTRKSALRGARALVTEAKTSLR
ncbi:MAG: hypothetical protein LBC97_09745 [Bifidobacteriaceae bacterium]|jgi:hypothetical protein|nr:hypothetical protein [Bifidobacteriaceae bacterium]